MLTATSSATNAKIAVSKVVSVAGDSSEDNDDDEDLDRFCRDCAMLRAMRVDGMSTSAKLRKIMEILDEIEDRGEGEKTIVFSQFTSMLDLIEPFLKKRGVRFVRCEWLSTFGGPIS